MFCVKFHIVASFNTSLTNLLLESFKTAFAEAVCVPIVSISPPVKSELNKNKPLPKGISFSAIVALAPVLSVTFAPSKVLVVAPVYCKAFTEPKVSTLPFLTETTSLSEMSLALA